MRWPVTPQLHRPLASASKHGLQTVLDGIRKTATPGTLSDPDVVLYATWISVWGRWFVWAVGLFLTLYRPHFWYPQAVEYLAIPVVLCLVNGLLHWRLVTDRSVSWRWLLALSATDVLLTTFGVVVGGGFPSFIFLAYYPALAILAVVFSAIWLNLAWTTTVAAVYVVVCLQAGEGLDFDSGQEKVLVARLAVMYVMVLGLGFITRFERRRWKVAVSRERQLRRERIELSQTIHDTIAQTAYMIGLGIHRARELAGDSNTELVAALDATATLSRSAMWEMRGPIDAAHILEGRALGHALWSHCATFEKITGVPASISQRGNEPSLATQTRSRLFAIAHNALTNAFLHARPGKVEVGLDFEPHQIRLSVSDDGVGLPADYSERGRGFTGMRADAATLGGSLIVDGGDEDGGLTITCVIPRTAEF